MGRSESSGGRGPRSGVAGQVLAVTLLGLAVGVAAAAEKRPKSLEGVVVDSAGKPVAGVDVFFATTGTSGRETFTQTQTGPDGRFRLAIPEAWRDAPEMFRVEGGVIAVKEGRGIAVLGFKRSAMIPSADVRLTLGASAGDKAAIRVLDPAGKPVAKAKVSVSTLVADALWLGVSEEDARKAAAAARQKLTATPLGFVIGKMQVPLPEPLEQKLSATTDGNGNAVVVGVARRDLAGVAVLSEKFGNQRISRAFADSMGFFRPGRFALDEYPESISLRQVGSLSGRLPSDRGGAVGASVRILTVKLPEQGIVIDSPDARLEHFGYADVTTNAEGKFSVPALATGTAIIQVRMPKDSPLRPAISSERLQIEPGKTAEIAIPLKRPIRATGIVRDAESGKPIPDVSLHITSASSWDPEVIRTDAAGRYQCLALPGPVLRMPVLPEGFIRVVVESSNMAAVEVPADKETFEFPPIELSRKAPPPEAAPRAEAAASKAASKRPSIDPKRYRVLAGRVVDRQGKPVAGATVVQSLAGPEPKAAATDAEGHFRLEGIWEGKSFVFASKEGFRRFGQAIDGLPQNLELVLARSTEPPRRVLKTLPLSMPRPDRLALARKLLEPAVKQAQAAKDDQSKLSAFQSLARVDPGRLLEILEGKAVSEADYDQMLRASAAIRLAKESPDDARAIAESMTTPTYRSMLYINLADASPSAERKLDLLGQALVQARANDDPPFRACALALAAKGLISLGKADQATKALREGEAVAKQLSVSDFAGYARGVLATELAPLDLPAALELTGGLTDRSEYDRHHGNIAQKLAGKKAADAERVLDMVRKDEDNSLARDQYAVRVCYRMATLDLPRARSIAARIKGPYYKAQAYGVMAQAMAAKDPAAAMGLLREAFGELERHVRSGNDAFNGMHSASSVAALLLSVAEIVDLKSVDEFLWQAVAFDPPRLPETKASAEGDPQSPLKQEADVNLAAMLARYDRELATVLFDPAWKSSAQRKFVGQRGVIVTAALLRPKEAAAAVENLPNDAASMDARCQLAAALAWEDESIWGRLQGRLLGMWKVDDEDLGSDD